MSNEQSNEWSYCTFPFTYIFMGFFKFILVDFLYLMDVRILNYNLGNFEY